MSEIDNHRLILHPERVAEWRKSGDCYPLYVEVGLTNRCNHRCSFCSLDWMGYKNVDMNPKVLISALEDMAKHGVISIMFAGEGEPFLHPEASSFIEHARHAGINVASTTNGVLFDHKKAEKSLPDMSWIRFSVDCGTAKTYAKVHGTKAKDFEKVIENIRTSVKIKKERDLDTSISVQALLLPDTIGELEVLGEILKESGVDNFQIKPFSYHPLSGNRFSVDYEQIKGLKERLEALGGEHFEVVYREKTIERVTTRGDYHNCHGLFFMALVDAKGDILPCNLYYRDKNFVYGNINHNSFSEVWEGQKRKEVIDRINKSKLTNCRASCRLDPMNRYLERLKNPEKCDDFI